MTTRAPQRSRGTAAVVLGRPDHAVKHPPPRDAAPPPRGTGWPRWFDVLAASALGAALLGIWALLVLGDSLRR
ncbi:MAG: hypothetical protein SF182_26320 [Deltaproteobacteria bacterium]|nr:hypothetical protein [Deltaproteobacteria bacterium]